MVSTNTSITSRPMRLCKDLFDASLTPSISFLKRLYIVARLSSYQKGQERTPESADNAVQRLTLKKVRALLRHGLIF